MTVDWNKPIICKENGARLEVVEGPDKDGDRRCKPIAPDTWPDGYVGSFHVRSDASLLAFSWHVINAPEATVEIPHWAKVRAAELFNVEYQEDGWDASDADTFCSIRALARYIAQHEPEPVDPDLVLAREAAAAAWVANGPGCPPDYESGKCDGTVAVQSALRAIKLVRERGA